ncbi:hypothetical protein [Rhizobium leguminosarum]|uniref:hypothetical protein n=1 Tax=Rhizobium leguminosarum TaxID=384 RepID=UPI003D07EECC
MDKDSTQELFELRSKLVTDRREAVSDGKADRLPDLMAQIDAIDRSILEEKKLAEIER